MKVEPIVLRAFIVIRLSKICFYVQSGCLLIDLIYLPTFEGTNTRALQGVKGCINIGGNQILNLSSLSLVYVSF
jgi:hypothetical protein